MTDQPAPIIDEFTADLAAIEAMTPYQRALLQNLIAALREMPGQRAALIAPILSAEQPPDTQGLTKRELYIVTIAAELRRSLYEEA